MFNANLLISLLSDDLLSTKFRKLKTKNSHPTFGHCYVASEVAYHLLDGDWKPMFINHEGYSHWFLKCYDGRVLDLTVKQFNTKPNYASAKGIGFLTKQISKRGKILMERYLQESKKAICDTSPMWPESNR